MAQEPNSNQPAPTAAASKPSGRGTKYMIETMTRSFLEVPKTTPSTDPVLKQYYQSNAKLTGAVAEITDLQDERDSVYRVQSQVTALSPNLESNPLIKPETKNQLQLRINDLMELIKQGINMDSTFTTLELKLSELKDQYTDSLKAYFNPGKKQNDENVPDNKTVTQAIEERSKEIDRLSRSFTSLHQQVERTYTETRSALPGTGPLNLKPFNALTAPKTESLESTAPKPG